jgi:hypothetical protein
MPTVPTPGATTPDAKPAGAQQNATAPSTGASGERRSGQGGGMPNMTEEQRAQMTEMRRLGTEVQTFLKSKFPDRAEEIDDRRQMSAMLDEAAVQTALKELGETWTKYEAMRQQMRSMMGGRGGNGAGGGGNR